jgi:hypothetical protein
MARREGEARDGGEKGERIDKEQKGRRQKREKRGTHLTIEGFVWIIRS